VENSLWKRLWTSRKTDYRENERTNECNRVLLDNPYTFWTLDHEDGFEKSVTMYQSTRCNV